MRGGKGMMFPVGKEVYEMGEVGLGVATDMKSWQEVNRNSEGEDI